MLEERSLESCVLPLQQPGASDQETRAAQLDAALQCLRVDLNRFARLDPTSLLDENSAAILNVVWREINILFVTAGLAINLMPAQSEITHADALMLIATYRGALGMYRIEQLGVNQYEL